MSTPRGVRHLPLVSGKPVALEPWRACWSRPMNTYHIVERFRRFCRGAGEDRRRRDQGAAVGNAPTGEFRPIR
jgi:hypothetical protein